MDFLTKVLAAMLGRFLGDELKVWLPFFTESLINFAVRRFPEQMRERYSEEWRSHIAEVPGRIGKLFCAIGFVWAGLRVWEGLKIDRLRSFAREYPGISAFVLRISASLFFYSYMLIVLYHQDRTFAVAVLSASSFVFGSFVYFHAREKSKNRVIKTKLSTDTSERAKKLGQPDISGKH